MMATNAYDAASRLAYVSDRTNSASYSFLANSPLVSQILFQQSGTTRMTTTKSYDNLNRLLAVSNTPSADSVISFNYAYNNANQRTAVTNADNSRWAYQYDYLGQATSGKKYWSDAVPVAGQQFEYGFDDIGNRKVAASGGDQWGANLRYQNYTANNLNQYTQRTVPGAVDIIGAAKTNATFTVNNRPSYRKGEYFRNEYPMTNAASSVYQSLTNLAVLNNGTNADITTTNIGNVFLPQTPEPFAYDADGNLTNDGRWAYLWDAENRLLSMISSNVVDAAKKKLEFNYDYMARRIEKKVSNWSGGTWQLSYDNRFMYDGWNLLAELNVTNNSVINGCLWGVDVSGSLRGAGGVGGLLVFTSIGNGVHVAAYDGNGNMAGLVTAAGGANSAQYEYGPFGEAIRATGPMAKANPFRFSTKFQDDETDLLYYGYRYLITSNGRWLSRDPLAENGARLIRDPSSFGASSDLERAVENATEQTLCKAEAQVYQFNGNDCINFIDEFGLMRIQDLWPSSLNARLLPTESPAIVRASPQVCRGPFLEVPNTGQRSAYGIPNRLQMFSTAIP